MAYELSIRFDALSAQLQGSVASLSGQLEFRVADSSAPNTPIWRETDNVEDVEIPTSGGQTTIVPPRASMFRGQEVARGATGNFEAAVGGESEVTIVASLSYGGTSYEAGTTVPIGAR